MDEGRAKELVIENQARESALRFKRCGVPKREFLHQSSNALDDLGLSGEARQAVMNIARRVADEVYGDKL